MEKDEFWETVEQEIENAMQVMFSHGAGETDHAHVEHILAKIAQRAFQAGRSYALLGLMTADDVAEHYGITGRRARALIANRHERFGIGMRFGRSWLIHRDELPDLSPDEKYRSE